MTTTEKTTAQMTEEIKAVTAKLATLVADRKATRAALRQAHREDDDAAIDRLAEEDGRLVEAIEATKVEIDLLREERREAARLDRMLARDRAEGWA